MTLLQRPCALALDRVKAAESFDNSLDRNHV